MATDSSSPPPPTSGVGVPADAGDPGTAKKKLEEHLADQAAFVETKLQPALDAAQQGSAHVFFVDASHFVMGTFLCCVWCFERLFVKAAAGRQRLNVLGAWNAVTQQLVSVFNMGTVNSELIPVNLLSPLSIDLADARSMERGESFFVVVF